MATYEALPTLVLHLDIMLAKVLEGEMLQHLRISKLATDKTFGIENTGEMSISSMLQRDTNDSCIVGVHADLILGSVANQTLIVGEATCANTICSSTTPHRVRIKVVGFHIDHRGYWEGCMH